MKYPKMLRKLCFGTIILVILLMAFGTGCSPENEKETTRTDDWNPNVTTAESSHNLQAGSRVMTEAAVSSPQSIPASTGGSGTIGFSTGGAKDIMNFRENIKNGYLPLPTDITYEGLFYDYYFDTGETERCGKLFCPSYSYAVTADPFSGETEYYLSVGLNSGLKESDFQRKKLNLVIVLDISGSMQSPFDRYYYDNFGKMHEISDSEAGKEKIEIATESIVGLLDHLTDDDLFGMVVFNNNARLAKPLNPVEATDMDAIRRHILDLTASGSTHMSAGMEMAAGLYNELKGVNPDEYENRIIFLTDAMPNTGDTSRYGLLGMAEENADNGIYTTFIGIGVDFNTELIEYITKIKGANYYSVHSSAQFHERMDEEFEYMVTPLVFDLQLTLDAEGWEIEKVYGSPEASEATGQLMKVNTLFPSRKIEDETRGGIVLLKMKRTGEENTIVLSVSYEDRNGKKDTGTTTVEFDDGDSEFFENRGIMKGVLLSRYADLLKYWMIDERDHIHYSHPWEPSIDEKTGICVPPRLGQWERQSIGLTVTEPYRKLFGIFYSYFDNEIGNIGDTELEQELEILDILRSF